MNTLVASTALSLALLAGSASAQLVVGNSQPSDPTLWLVDLAGAQPPRALATGFISVGPANINAGVAWGAAADEHNRVLYWNNDMTLFSAPYLASGPLAPHGVAITLAGTTTATPVTGLAFDTVENKLYAFKSTNTIVNGVTYPVGIYHLDTTTGQAALVLATPGVDYGGFDYDADTDSFYALNDSPLGPGRGLVHISKPLASATITLIAGYPGDDTDIDGLAVGNGRAYFVNDTPVQGIPVYNLVGNFYEPTLASPFTATGALFAAGAWAPGLMELPPTCGTSDFDGDGDFGTDSDIETFFACLAGDCCSSCFAGGSDFNMDGDSGTDADIEAFFRVLAGGTC